MNLASPITMAIVAVLVSIAGAWDVRSFRVPNLFTLPLLLLGIAYHTVAGGLSGLESSIVGALFGFGVLFGLYLLGAMGAGDVKLMAAIGAWLGVSATICVFAISAAATALYSIGILLWQRRLGQSLMTIQLAILQLTTMAKHLGAAERVESLVRHKDRRKRLVPFAAMLALATIVMLIWGPYR